MTAYDEQHLGELLSALPPAPEALVSAAKGLPLARQRLEEIVERARADADYRRRVVADTQRVLEEADVVAHAENIQILRRRLGENSEPE